ncbi:MAG: hypothetical protein LC104_06720 [Bacteroidales bacterium]|nr:hypothetical protein [Bacteroidales bacterium]
MTGIQETADIGSATGKQTAYDRRKMRHPAAVELEAISHLLAETRGLVSEWIAAYERCDGFGVMVSIERALGWIASDLPNVAAYLPRSQEGE